MKVSNKNRKKVIQEDLRANIEAETSIAPFSMTTTIICVCLFTVLLVFLFV